LTSAKRTKKGKRSDKIEEEKCDCAYLLCTQGTKTGCTKKKQEEWEKEVTTNSISTTEICRGTTSNLSARDRSSKSKAILRTCCDAALGHGAQPPQTRRQIGFGRRAFRVAIDRCLGSGASTYSAWTPAGGTVSEMKGTEGRPMLLTSSKVC